MRIDSRKELDNSRDCIDCKSELEHDLPGEIDRREDCYRKAYLKIIAGVTLLEIATKVVVD
jgi:hypothetical protein